MARDKQKRVSGTHGVLYPARRQDGLPLPVTGAAGAAGPAGPTGPTGPTGPAGADGATVEVYCRAYHSLAAVVAGSNPLALDSEDTDSSLWTGDPANLHSTSSNTSRIVMAAAGSYWVFASTLVVWNNTGTVKLAIRHDNGSGPSIDAEWVHIGASGDSRSAYFGALIKFVATGWVEIYVVSEPGSTSFGSTTVHGDQTELTVYRIGSGLTGPTGASGPVGATGPASAWGTIPGTLSSQTDLQTALNLKEDKANKNAASGYAGLDAGANLPVSLLSNGTFTVVDSTATGAQNNWAPGLNGNTLVTWHGASDIALTGIAGGVVGQIVIVKNTGTKVATFAHNSGSSSAGNKLFNLVTSAATPVAPGGWIAYQYDGAQWQLIEHEQGAYITPTYAAGDYMADNGAGTWTVQAGDVQTDAYYLKGRQLTYSFSYRLTTVAGTPNALQRTLPTGFAIAKTGAIPLLSYNEGAGWIAGWIETGGTATYFSCYRTAYGATNWTNTTNATFVAGIIPIEVT